MTTEYSSGGDPARTMALLWGRQKRPTRGPKQGLTVERIAAAATEIADADGLAALSMRSVAERLGVSTMALYTYVPSKAVLIDLLLDTAYGEAIPDGLIEGGWRDRLERVARDTWAMYRRHPWMLQVAALARPVLGPNAVAMYDHQLRAVDGIGLDEVEMDSVVGLVTGHAEAAARRAAEMAQTERDSGRTDAQWWEIVAPLLEQVYEPGRYPVADRVGPVVGAALQSAYSPEHAFEFGLQRVLDGVEALVRARQQGRGGGA